MAWTAADEAELLAAEAKVAQLPKAKNPELSLGESAMAGLKKLPGQALGAVVGVAKAIPGAAYEVMKPDFMRTDEERLQRAQNAQNIVSGVGALAGGGVQQIRDLISTDATKRTNLNNRYDTSAIQGVENALYDRYGNYRNIKNTMANDPLGIVLDVGSLAGIAAPAKAARTAKLLADIGESGVAATARQAAKIRPKNVAARLTEPLPIEDAKLVQKYELMGGHLRPGQYSPSNFMRQGDAVAADTPFPRVSGFKADHPTRITPESQSDEYGRFISRTFGEDAPRITEEVINSAETRIGKVYKDVLPRNSVLMDPDLSNAMASIDDRIASSFEAMKPEDATRISAVMARMRLRLDNEGLSGKLYQNYRARGGLLDEMAGSESPVLSSSARDMREALDDAFSRQAKGTDGEDLRQARQQYRALKTVKTLADKAPAGRINPGQVLNAVVKEYGSAANAGELGTLGQVGSAFLKQMPSSGTAERSLWRSLANAPFSEGLPAIGNAVIGLPVSAIGTRRINKTINSPEMRAKLLARLLSQTP
jgi:hypothetical protein